MPNSPPLRHLLDIERLTVVEINALLDLTERYTEQSRLPMKKTSLLEGRVIVNLFFEPSTRTRTSFEIAAKRLGADVVTIDVETSSTKKGETLLDTALNLDAMKIDALVIRHTEDGVPQFLAPQMKAAVINAGDGRHEHPTQALVDASVMRSHKKELGGLTVAICGDISHSRVARSNIHLLTKFGAKVRTVSPPYFATKIYEPLGITNYQSMEEGIKDADVVMMLRIQHERMAKDEFSNSVTEYHKSYGLDYRKLAVAKPDVLVMHPGPVDRDVEIASQLADDPKYSVIREQVERGVALRMAVLDTLLCKQDKAM